MRMTSWLSSYRRSRRIGSRFLKRRKLTKPSALFGIEMLETRTLLSGTPLELSGVLSDDTYISGSAHQTEKNYDTELSIIVDGAPDIAALFKIDTSGIASDSLVQSASLTFHVTDASVGTWEIYEVLRTWNSSEVTYDWPSVGQFWEIDGAQGTTDRGTTVLGTLTATATGTVTVNLNAAGVAVVQKWVDDPSSNHGLIIQDYLGSADELKFDSSEAAVSANRPTFSIIYTGTGGTNGNLAPVVDAGPDQSVDFGQTVSLDGTVSDDGLPTKPGSVTTNWAVVSGPGNVTFGNTGSVDTTATFSAAGTYVLRLRADDGELATMDIVEITVTDLSGNVAPVVDAGPDQTVFLTSNLYLNGNFTDDGIGTVNPVTTHWTQVSGPGTATFFNADMRITTATFNAAGTYVLQLSASDGLSTGTDLVTINVYELGGNTAPAVSAGDDLTILLNQTANLNGVVVGNSTPDPNAAPVTASWTLLSGPGSVTFGNLSSASTTATFSAAGTYVLQLQGNDGTFASNDTVTVTVNALPVNQAPVVDAGPDRTIAQTNTLHLNASVTDDGISGPLTTTWSVVSGPGTVTFTTASLIDAAATFSVAGTYVLRLTANDGQYIRTDDVSVTVLTNSSGSSTTVSLQNGLNGYTGTDDTYLRGSGRAAGENFGSEPTIILDGSPDFGALIRWNLSSIAAGSQVTAASISVYVTDTTPHTYEIYKLKRAWSENEATWFAADNATSWSGVGASGSADRDSIVLGTLTSTTSGWKTFQLNAAALAVIQGWINNPATNFGFAIQDYADATSDSLGFASSEVALVSQRPMLSLTVGQSAPPAGQIDLLPLANQTMPHSQDVMTVNLPTSGATGTPIYSFEFTSTNPNAPLATGDVVGSINGTTLTINPSAAYTGQFQVKIHVRDDVSDDVGTFLVTVGNSSPVLAPISNQTVSQDDLYVAPHVLMAAGSTMAELEAIENSMFSGFSVQLAATDADGDSISYSASASGIGQLAQLDQTHGFTASDALIANNYFYSSRGLGEKYLQGDDGWYVLLEDGSLYFWKGDLAQSALVANVGAAVFNDPNLLWKAYTPVSLKFDGNTLWIEPPLGYAGTFAVLVTADDGIHAETSTFNVTITAGVIQPFQFDDTARWSTTATNGGGLTQGAPTTLTWSIVPDGTSIPGFAGESAAPSNLITFLDGIYGASGGSVENKVWFPIVQSMFDRWGELSGITYVYAGADDGATFSDAPGVLGVRGDVRISGHNIDGDFGILAYNFFPNVGDMVVDTGDIFYSDTAQNSIGLRNVLTHEAGHGLGLEHVEPINETKLMEPFYSNRFDGPQFDDILAIHRGYGDNNEEGNGNDTASNATNMGTFEGSTLSVGRDAPDVRVAATDVRFVSIDDDSDVDFYRFTLTETQDLEIKLIPRGPTYNQGPQGGTPTLFRSNSQSNLSLELFNASGSTQIDSSNSAGLGGTETITATLNAGEYVIRVSGAQNAAQLYQLDVGLPGGTDSTVVVTNEAGVIRGTKFYDVNANGIWESPIGNITLAPIGPVILTRNDDLSTDAVDLGFTLNFFGQDYTEFYINNNGNVTFTSPLGDFLPSGFPQQAGFPMIAPFWADVDTRSTGSGEVHFTSGVAANGSRFAQVDWPAVGYYNNNTDKLNTFTLYIQDDPAGDIVVFAYGDMQWTTGDVDGVGGFGGEGAQIGFDSGDGINFFSFGRPNDAASLTQFANTQFGFRLIENGVTTGEPALAGVTVYIDANNNGKLDGNELSTVTRTDDPTTIGIDETGTFVFTGLSAGTYIVREVVPTGFVQTRPTGNGSYSIPITSTTGAAGLQFGNALGVSLSITSFSIDEPGGVATVTASVSQPALQDIIVELGFSGVAVEGTDFAASDTFITILAGETTGSITLTGIDDALIEGDEDFDIDILSVINGAALPDQQLTATVNDDDIPPTVFLDVVGSPFSENGGTATIRATLDHVFVNPVVVNLAFSGTAFLGLDYTRSGTSITINAGDLVGTIALAGVNDDVFEATESIVASITSIQNGFATFGNLEVTAYITDDDGVVVAPNPKISMSISPVIFSENGGSATVTLTRDTRQKTSIVELGYTGTAIRGTDYNAPTFVTMPFGVLSTTFTITGINDLFIEPDESIIVDMVTVFNGTEAGGFQQVAATITSDDILPPVTLDISNTDLNENGGSATITATLLGAPAPVGGATIFLGFAGTATYAEMSPGSGIVDFGRSDYTYYSLPTTPGTPITQPFIFIPEGKTTGTLRIEAINDPSLETSETIIVSILSATGAVEFGNQQVTATIIDDEPSATSAANWVSQGPSPTQNGQVENISPNGEVVGAIHTVVAHPTNPDVLWIGAVNGGIWRTENATAASPTWIPLTDDLPSLSIGALGLDPANPDRLIVGIGRNSSFAQVGGRLTGLLLSEDGGDSWTEVSDPLLTGENFSGVAARGNILLAAANDFGNEGGAGGLFRSTNGGTTWTLISGGSGLPTGAIFDLVGDPTDADRFYVSIRGIGIFRSDNAGASWTQISQNDASAGGLDDTITQPGNNNAEMAVSPTTGRLYVAVVINGRAQYIGYTDNFGAAWTEMDLPMTPESNGEDEGLNPTEKPGAQGYIHFSIVTDPNNANIVYVGGDRQDSPFPNFIGANNFTGRLFRGDTTVAPTSGSPSPQWEHLTHRNNITQIPGGGTASNSAPHADSREMVFDAAGRLIETDDGGIYVRTNPQNNTGDWFSIIGNLAVTEFHDIAYDSNSDILIGGAQDTGTPQQTAAGSQVWTSVSTADGGDVAVDNITLAGSNQSIRYSSFQNLGNFRRQTYDAANNLLNTVNPTLTVAAGGDPLIKQFVTPIELNAIDPRRLLIGGANSLYESLDQGDNITDLNTPAVNGNGVSGNAMAYGGTRGGVDNPDVLYFGSGSSVRVRTTAGGAITAALGYAGGFVRDVVLDTTDWMKAFVIDSDQVFLTDDAGATFADITGTLSTVTTDFRSLAYVVGGASDVIVLGTQSGVFASLITSLGTWFKVGNTLPTVPVWDLDYDADDDVLVAGTFGRGAWLLDNASTVLNGSGATGGNAQVSLSLNNSLVAENGGTASLTAILSNSQAEDVLVELTLDGTADLFVAGTGDYTLFGQFASSPLTIRIRAGETSGSILLTSLDDDTFEGADETFIVDIANVIGGNVQIAGGSQSVTGTITEGDLPASSSQLFAADPSYTIDDHLVSTTVFVWYNPTDGQMDGPWQPLEGRANWTGDVDFWKRQIKDMMDANIDVLYVIMFPPFATERTNLFQAAYELRSEGYDIPKLAPFFDTVITYDLTSPIDVATEAGKDDWVSYYIEFFDEYYSVNTDPFADDYIFQLDGKVVLNNWHNLPDQVMNLDQLTRDDVESRLIAHFGSDSIFANGIHMIGTALNPTAVSFVDEKIVQFEQNDYYIPTTFNGITTAQVKPGYWDQNVRDPGDFLARDGGTHYIDAWGDVNSNSDLVHVNVESWNELDEGTGIFEADPTSVLILGSNPNNDDWSTTDNPREYIDTTAAGAQQFNETPDYGAQVIWTNLPSQMAPGETVTVTMIVRNTGDIQWTDADGFAFEQDPSDAAQFLASPDALDETAAEVAKYSGVFRGRPVVYEFDITAPTTVGTFETKWNMRSDASGAFGQQFTQFITVGSTPGATLSVDPVAFSENGGTTTVTVTLSEANPTDPVTVVLGFSGGAMLGADYSASGTMIVIPANALTGSITLTGINNDSFEGDKHLSIEILTVENAVEQGVQQVSATVLNDDLDPSVLPKVSLSFNYHPIQENGGKATITAILEEAQDNPVTVDLLFSGSATFGTDYVITGGTLVDPNTIRVTIPANALFASVTLTSIQDNTNEGNETVIVDIEGVTGGVAEAGNNNGHVEGLILDADIPGSISGIKYYDQNANGIRDTIGNGAEIELAPIGPVILPGNDDGSTDEIQLGFTLNFFGTDYTSFYINNNGNVTFGGPQFEFTPDGFPTSTGFPMIAPFWADVDTRSSGSGEVHFTSGTSSRGNRFVQVDWPAVGYYSFHTDLLNTFTLYIEDDPSGDIVVFDYGNMQWTTGDASGGVGGFGSTGAEIGFDAGNGINFLSYGRPNSSASVAQFSNQQLVFRLNDQGEVIGEPGLAGVTIYIDANESGTLDLGELSTVTMADDPSTTDVDETGFWEFTGLTPGETYIVREVVPFDYYQTAPTNPGYYTVELGSGDNITGLEFGNARIIHPTVDLDISKNVIPENGGFVTVTATLSVPTTVDVTVNLDVVTGSTATVDSDFTISTVAIVIPAGSLTGTATIIGQNDTDPEPIEKIRIDFSPEYPGEKISGFQPLIVYVVDDDTPGPPNVIVEDAASVEEGDGEGTFTTGFGVQPELYNTSTNTVSGRPNWVTTGDMNGDGYVDVVQVNTIGNSISVMLNRGDGTFNPGTSWNTGSNPSSAVVADLDGDGDLDVAVTRDAAIAVLLNNGDATFVTGSGAPAGLTPFGITSGDFDGDGDVDLAVANYANGTNTVTLLWNNGNAVYGLTPVTTISVGAGPMEIKAGDIDGDGDIDLVVAQNGGASTSVAILRNNGTGSFTVSFAEAGPRPRSLVLGDFNGDGKVDVAVTNVAPNPVGSGYANTVSVLLGNGNGTFQAPLTFAAGPSVLSLTAADLDVDGDLDLIVSNDDVDDHVLSVLFNDGSGSFGAPEFLSVGNFHIPYAVAAADVDLDGDPDIISAVRFGSSGVDSMAVFRSDADPNVLLFNVFLTKFSTNTVTVDYSTIAGTAIPGVDFLPTSGTLVFAPGEIVHTVAVPIIGELYAEANETLTLALSNVTGGAVISDGSGSGTIVNDDGPFPALVSLSVGNNSIGENDGSTTITAFLTNPVDHDVIVELGFTGSAANNTDYRVTSSNAPISIDGSFDDWHTNPNVVFFNDPLGDTHDTDTTGAGNTPLPVEHPDVDLLQFAVTHDDENFYFYFKADGEIGRTQIEDLANGLAAGRYYIIVTMDVDNNDATGYELHEGGYYPTTSGYDMNAEIEYFNGAFNTGNYLNHGATDAASRNLAFEQQSSDQFDSSIPYNSWATQGPFDPGFVNILPGTYDYYTQWVYQENNPGIPEDDKVVFVKDKGPVVLGNITGAASADGHEYEYVVPFKGFLVNQFGDPVIAPGRIVDLSFSLEASGELAPDGEWASDTANPINGYAITQAAVTPVTTILIPAGQTSASITLTGLGDADDAEGNELVTIAIVNVTGANENGAQSKDVTILDGPAALMAPSSGGSTSSPLLVEPSSTPSSSTPSAPESGNAFALYTVQSDPLEISSPTTDSTPMVASDTTSADSTSSTDSAASSSTSSDSTADTTDQSQTDTNEAIDNFFIDWNLFSIFSLDKN